MMPSHTISRRTFCRSALAGAASLAVGRDAWGAPRRRPNLLLITTDDLGVQLGCYGDRIARTPNLDRLASQGSRFACAYVTQASCSPSRSSIFTGLYPHQNGQVGLSHRGYAMREGLPTLPSLLKDAGYFTGVMGKIHVAHEKTMPFDFRGIGAGRTRDVQAVAESAGEFFTQAGDRPFFFMANLFDPHRPLLRQVEGVPEKPYGPDDVKPFPFLAGVDTEKVRTEVAAYYDCVARIDVAMGLLMERLEKAGHAEDTLVLFLGDNGPPFTRGKTTCYESGVQTPFLVRWPGHARAGQVSDALVSTIDILPTFLEAAGAKAPAELAGRSLLPVLEGKQPRWRDTLCTEYTSHHEGGYFPRRAIRDRRHKLILNLLPDRPNPIKNVDGCAAFAASQEAQYDGTPTREVMERHANPPAVELYDLQEDPTELRNLAGTPEAAKVEKRLLEQLEAWRRETRDPLLDPANLAELTRRHDEKQVFTPPAPKK